MYLHLGEGQIIPTKDIVMIGNIKTTDNSKINREFMNVTVEEGFIVDYSRGDPRSFVLTGETVYLSRISSNTLLKRLTNLPEKTGDFNVKQREQ